MVPRNSLIQSASISGVSSPSETFPYLSVYRALPTQRIAIIERGIPAAEAKRILGDLGVGQSTVCKVLKLSVATLNKRATKDQILPIGESERVIGIAKLIGQIESMVEESGNPEGFDAAAWFGRWLTGPLPAYGGICPIDFMGAPWRGRPSSRIPFHRCNQALTRDAAVA